MSENSLHIVVDTSTERLKYIFDFMFKELQNIPYYIIEKQDYNGEFKPNLIHYGAQKPLNGLWFKSHSLLFEKGVRNISFDKVDYLNFKYPFSVGDGGELPFDPFALGFYFLTQYEEHQKNIPLDIHGRFVAVKSNIKNYIEFPMVEISSLIVRKIFEKYEFTLPPRINQYSFSPTFDIDIAFAHLAKPIKRHVLGSAKLIAKVELVQLKDRIKVWTKAEHDSYDVFDVIINILKTNNLDAVFFALVAKNTPFDKNNSPKSKLYQELLQKLSEHSMVELHSSYYVSEKNTLFDIEKQCLEKILSKKITSNRQHFLRFRLPDYWHLLIKHNILNDYSVGFTDCWGYRSGTSMPHNAFDLIANKKLPLIVHPFVFMDTALKKVYNDDVIQMTDKMMQIIEETKQNGYPLIGVWHNYAMPAESLYLDSFINVLSHAKK